MTAKKLKDFKEETSLEDMLDEVLGEVPEIAFLISERRTVVPAPKGQGFKKHTFPTKEIGLQDDENHIAVIPRKQPIKIKDEDRLQAEIGGFKYPIKEIAIVLRQFARVGETDIRFGFAGDGDKSSLMVIENEEVGVFITPSSLIDEMNIKKKQEEEEEEEEEGE